MALQPIIECDSWLEDDEDYPSKSIREQPPSGILSGACQKYLKVAAYCYLLLKLFSNTKIGVKLLSKIYTHFITCTSSFSVAVIFMIAAVPYIKKVL